MREETSEHRGSASPVGTTGIALAAWSVSLLLHLLGLAGMLWIVFPYVPESATQATEARIEWYGDVFAPESVSTAAVAPALSDALKRLAPRAVPAEWSTTPPAPDVSPPSISALSGRGGEAGDEQAGASGPGSGLSIIGVGASGGSGDITDFGLSGGGGGGGVEFFGAGPTRGVKAIVYVVDCSASMLDTFQHVRAELRRSVGKLRRGQKFHVLFFRSGEPFENPPQKLVSAIESQKKAFFEFLETVRPTGGTHPEPAMRRALALEPDVIYFLTDGEFDSGLLPRLDEWNKDRRVRIYTIAYFDLSGAALLERIARDHRGEFRFVSERDLP